MNKMTSRILLNIAIISSVFYFPWWLVATLVVIGAFLFDGFYEMIFIGFLLDVLYGARAEEFYGIWFVFTIIFTTMYIIIKRLKKNIRFYETI